MIRFVPLVLLVPALASAQTGTTAMDCVPPLIPQLTASDELIRDYGPELRAEFDRYFDDAQTYIRCLQAASDTARTEVSEVLSAYTAMFPNQ
ncbi:hypothetical protein [Palleronia rufa]|uniref:hypothetical protein n=1 Tax=Palleronia rufa TaxID=1530186 RepID=UPI00056CCC4E|nr:hypothetical protein [Palleronia rufa]